MYKHIMRPYAVPMKPLPTPIEPKNNLESAVRAILFDIYGTLLVSSSGDIGISRENTLMTAPMKTLLDKYQISIHPMQLRRQLFEAIEGDHAFKKNRASTIRKFALKKSGIRYSGLKISKPPKGLPLNMK